MKSWEKGLRVQTAISTEKKILRTRDGGGHRAMNQGSVKKGKTIDARCPMYRSLKAKNEDLLPKLAENQKPTWGSRMDIKWGKKDCLRGRRFRKEKTEKTRATTLNEQNGAARLALNKQRPTDLLWGGGGGGGGGGNHSAVRHLFQKSW